MCRSTGEIEIPDQRLKVYRKECMHGRSRWARLYKGTVMQTDERRGMPNPVMHDAGPINSLSLVYSASQFWTLLLSSEGMVEARVGMN